MKGKEELGCDTLTLPSPFSGCVVTVSKGERQSGSKVLGCGSFRLLEIVTCIKSNVFICLAHLNLNG